MPVGLCPLWHFAPPHFAVAGLASQALFATAKRQLPRTSMRKVKQQFAKK